MSVGAFPVPLTRSIADLLYHPLTAGTMVTTTTINNASLPGSFTTGAFSGAVTMTAGTASTNTTTGTAVITGGLGVSGAIFAGATSGVTGSFSVSANLSSGGQMQAGSNLRVANQCVFGSASPGNAIISTSTAGDSINRLQIGCATLGTLSDSFPSLYRAAGSTTLAVKLGNSTTDAPFTASNITASGTLAVTGNSSLTTGAFSGGLTLSASAGTITGGTDASGSLTISSGSAGASRTLIFQTTTAGGTPTTALTIGANQYATFAGSVTAGLNLTAGGGYNIGWSSSTQIQSPANGQIVLTNSISGDLITSIQFGGNGQSDSYPRLYRAAGSTTIGVKLGNSTTDAPFTASNITASGTLAVTGIATFSSKVNLKSYTVGTLPSASTAGGIIYVSDAAVAPCVAFTDNTNWKRCDNAATTVV